MHVTVHATSIGQRHLYLYLVCHPTIVLHLDTGCSNLMTDGLRQLSGLKTGTHNSLGLGTRPCYVFHCLSWYALLVPAPSTCHRLILHGSWAETWQPRHLIKNVQTRNLVKIV